MTMNSHLDRAMCKITEISAVLHAIDEVYLEDADGGLQNLFYVLEDLVHSTENELELLTQDRMVVNAIYAVNDAKRRTLTTD